VTEPLTGVSRTALWVAYLRAQESEAPEPLFHDPYARRFLEAAPGWPPAVDADGAVAAAGNAFAWQTAVRTRFFDEALLAVAHGGCRQIVLLAAGLDTRAFRLEWPAGTRLFEVDMSTVVDFKEAVLARHGATPRCHRVVVPADLRDAWPQRLAEAGFDAGDRAAWLMEGLLVYLTAPEAARLLTDVTAAAAPGSHLFVEHGGIDPRAIDPNVWLVPAVREVVNLWRGGLGERTPGWLAERGWRVRTHDLDVVAAAYQRPAPVAVIGGFATAVRTEG